nr:hypothetical protein [uncultured Holophaga sp.]
MSNGESGKGLPTWFMGCVIALLALLSALTWMNGAMLNRQHHELVALREDVQYLTDNLDNGSSEEEDSLTAARLGVSHRARRFTRIDEERDPALKELEESRKSAREAVQEARETQRKVSIEENARLADEKAKLESARHSWTRWTYGAIVVVLVTLGLRAWLRRRG